MSNAEPSKIVGWQIALVASIGVGHFALSLALGERKLADYFTAEWAVESALMLSLPFLVWAAFSTIEAMRLKSESPVRHIYDKIRSDPGRFAVAGALLLAYLLVNRAYRAIKVSIPSIQPFYADSLFADWDRWLFGIDPWRITHALIGETGTLVIDRLYILWGVVILATFALTIFSKDRRFQIQGGISYLLVWIVLGNLMAIGMASVGPCFYDDFYGEDRFLPLMQTLGQYDTAAILIQDFLVNTRDDAAIGAGISAMPSVHCAMTMLIVILTWNRFGVGWQFALATTYHIVILIGSVHLAWHYALDGILSTILVPVLWWAVGRLLLAFGLRSGSREAAIGGELQGAQGIARSADVSY